MNRRGFTLLETLVALAIMGLILAAYTGSFRLMLGAVARQETTTDATDARASTARDFAACSKDCSPAVNHWPPSGVRTIRAGGRAVEVAIADQAGSVDLNTASPATLAALMVALGRSTADAATLAAAIVEWRSPLAFGQRGREAAARYRAAGQGYAPPAAPFQSIGELGLVLGMTPGLLARLRPYLTLWGSGDPDPALAAPLVRAALRNLPSPPPGDTGSGRVVVAITCRIEGGPGRRVVVELQPSAERPFRIVASEPLPAE